MKWNFQKWLHNRESRDIFFCAILVVIPFHSDSVAKIYFFWNPYQEVKTKSHWERITILFSSQSMKIFQCKSKSRLFLPFFFSWYRGTYFIEISPQFVRFVSTVIQGHKGMVKEWSMIFARVCICAGSISVHWIKTIRNIWANDWYFYVAFETVYGREAGNERKREGRKRRWRRRRRRNKSVPLFVAP